jgi:chaperonin cofactor prefoldin
MAEDLEEASNELIITDDDSVRFGVGETFVLVENDDAETMLEKLLAETNAEVDALELEKKNCRAAWRSSRKSCTKSLATQSTWRSNTEGFQVV